MKTAQIPFVDDGSIRGHPWRGSEYSDQVEYYDFKTNPELIRAKLEDLKPYTDWPAINRFYELLEWLNGPDSFLETNDCAFRGPAENQNPQMAFALECRGRIMLLFRELKLNILSHWVSRLEGAVGNKCADIDPDFQGGMVATELKTVGFFDLPEDNR